MDTTKFGDRMKEYERREAGRRTMKRLPVIIRLDGKNFSRLSKKLNLAKPFDPWFASVMDDTCHYLVRQTGAILGYVQSDEISLLLYSDNHKSQIFFDGKIQKLVSVTAAMASVKFAEELAGSYPPPVFDARVWTVPNKMEAANCFIWREQDCSRNSILGLAQFHLGEKKCHGKNCKHLQEELWQEHKINWSHGSRRFKRGAYFARRECHKVLNDATLAKIPEGKRPVDGVVIRKKVVELELPKLSSIANIVDVIFSGDDPVIKESNEKV